jgi:FtsP/CotA-like multicopper oxidase with cupredoxin domain
MTRAHGRDGTTTSTRRSTLREAWSQERAAAHAARTRGDAAGEWRHLERAHILSQPMAGPHVRTHAAMLAYGFRQRDRREVVGQLLRLVVAGPGSWTGRYPLGNTGGANVSAVQPMPVPEDLRAILESTVGSVDPKGGPMTDEGHGDSSVEQGTFSTDTTGLEDCAAPTVVSLADGDAFDLRIAPVAKQLDDARVRMLAYNGSIPGPTLRVPQDAEISVRVRNDGDVDATVHWHGLRLDNRYDGVPHETQDPIPLGGEFTYRVRFPDPGLYWYHPHIREDYGLDMGLYGNIVVVPAEDDYWPPVNREVVLTLDDVLVEDGRIASFNLAGPTHVAMGRFGNVMLTGGETSLELRTRAGEVVRLYLTNTANTRIFNIALPGARMKLVGGDSGRYEHEGFVDEVLLAPSERAILDVLFDTPGPVPLEHRTPGHTYVLGTVRVGDEPVDQSVLRDFELLRANPEWTAERAAVDAVRQRPPDKTLAFESLMPLLYGDQDAAASAWTCPMHPDVVASEPGTCPSCGMQLIPTTPSAWTCPMHPDVVTSEPGTCPSCGMKLVPSGAASGAAADHAHSHDMADGLEWEDLMPEINRASDAGNMIWKLVDRDTGKDNWEIDWAFQVGDRVKIRLVNDMEQDHPMHHPFHIHGAGRFLVIARDGEPEPNLVWKDTVLVRANETVDILLDVSNPGLWMAHCHIAEHNQAGMMFSFPVSDKERS